MSWYSSLHVQRGFSRPQYAVDPQQNKASFLDCMSSIISTDIFSTTCIQPIKPFPDHPNRSPPPYYPLLGRETSTTPPGQSTGPLGWASTTAEPHPLPCQQPVATPNPTAQSSWEGVCRASIRHPVHLTVRHIVEHTARLLLPGARDGLLPPAGGTRGVLLTFCSWPDATPRIALTGPGVMLGEKGGRGIGGGRWVSCSMPYNTTRRCPAGNAVGVVQGLGGRMAW